MRDYSSHRLCCTRVMPKANRNQPCGHPDKLALRVWTFLNTIRIVVPDELDEKPAVTETTGRSQIPDFDSVCTMLASCTFRAVCRMSRTYDDPG